MPKILKWLSLVALVGILALRSTARADATIGVNVAALSQSTAADDEPDVSGAAGMNSYAEFVNGDFGVFDKSTGAMLSQATDQTFWENAGMPAASLSSGASNPRLIYDPNSGRWFATEITNDSSSNSILLAVSTGSDPSATSGNWRAVSFSAAAVPGNPYGSFPTLGMDANGVYIATDDYPNWLNAASAVSTGGGGNQSLFSIPKASLLSSSPSVVNMTTFVSTDDYQSLGYILQPVIDFGAQKGSAVVIADNYSMLGAINLVNVVGNTAAKATLSAPQTVNLNPYAFPPSPRQPDGSGNFSSQPGLTIPDDRYASSAYQVGNLIYSVHTVGLPAGASDPASCALQWSVLKVVNDTTTDLVQQGMIANSNYDFFNPSICANAAGDVVIGYNRSGPSPGDGMILSLISVGTTTNGLISFEDAIQVSTSTVTSFHNSAGGSPWGDYSSVSPDPSNSSIFWFAQEVPLPSGTNPAVSDSWGTQITEVEVPEPVALPALVLLGWFTLRRHRTVT